MTTPRTLKYFAAAIQNQLKLEAAGGESYPKEGRIARIAQYINALAAYYMGGGIY